MSERDSSGKNLQRLAANTTASGLALLSVALLTSEQDTHNITQTPTSKDSAPLSLLDQTQKKPDYNNYLRDRLSFIAAKAIARNAYAAVSECWINFYPVVFASPESARREVLDLAFDAWVANNPQIVTSYRVATMEKETGKGITVALGSPQIKGFPQPELGQCDPNCTPKTTVIVKRRINPSDKTFEQPSNEVPFTAQCNCTWYQDIYVNDKRYGLPPATPTRQPENTPVVPTLAPTPTPVAPPKLPYGDGSCDRTKKEDLPLNPDGTCQGSIPSFNERVFSTTLAQKTRQFQLTQMQRAA
jgi:hypothetical protein